MRNISLTLLASILLTACQQTPKDSTTISDTSTASLKCYRYSNGKDSVLASITYQGDSVRGTLAYYLYEKDKNTGALKGRIVNDVLIADYTFQSEGTLSTRQVAFKKQGERLTEGHGDIVNNDGSETFKNIDSLTFGNTIILAESNCP